MRKYAVMVAMFLTATTMVVTASPAFAGPVYHGIDKGDTQRRSDGKTRAVFCDREPGSRAGGWIRRNNGDNNYYYDPDGAGGRCGYSPWGNSKIISHSIGEGGPYGSWKTHYHRI
jgi:hypothetical protein